MQLDPITTPLIVGIAGKIFISAANAMPAPPSNGGYWQRWFHDFVQDLASNSSKIGTTRPPGAKGVP